MQLGNMGMHQMPAELPQIGMPRGMQQVVPPYYPQMPPQMVMYRMPGPGSVQGYPQPGMVMPQQQLMGGMQMGPRMSMLHQPSMRLEMGSMHPNMQSVPPHAQHAAMHGQIRGGGGLPGGPASASHVRVADNHGQAPPTASVPLAQQGPAPSTS